MNSNRNIFYLSLFFAFFFVMVGNCTRNALDMINFIKRSMRINKATVTCFLINSKLSVRRKTEYSISEQLFY